MPEDMPTDNGGEIHLRGETVAVLFIGQEIGGEWQPTSGQNRDQTVVAEGTEQAIERHRQEMVEHRAQLQTEAAVHGQQRITGDLRSHLAIAEHEVREHREHRATRGALDAPDGEPTQTDAHIMRVARQAPTAATGGLVLKPTFRTEALIVVNFYR